MLSNNLRNTTNRLTNKFGDTIILNEISQGIYDPITGKTLSDVSIPHKLKGVVSSITSNDVIPDIVLIDDLNVLVYADSLDINKSWTVTYNTRLWKVLNVTLKTLQDKRIYYKLQIRSQ